MITVITNSRRHALNKLMSSHGVKHPLPDIEFIESTDQLNDWRESNDTHKAILIWQRGRLTQDAKRLHKVAQELIGIGAIKSPFAKGH